jgi:hypothetical protein
MAKLNGSLSFTGSLGAMVAYNMQGVDKVVLRQKSVGRIHAIKHGDNFELTRRYNQEWKACIKASGHISRALYGVKHLADYNFSGKLNALCKHIQNDDKLSDLGSRSILVSTTGYKLEGFSLNKYNGFSSFVNAPIAASIYDNYATVQLPNILPGINFFNPRKHPLYRLVFVLANAPDITYNTMNNQYEPDATYEWKHTIETTEWHTQEQSIDAKEITLQLINYAATQKECLVVSIGVEFGNPTSNTVIQSIKYAGAAMVLKIA